MGDVPSEDRQSPRHSSHVSPRAGDSAVGTGAAGRGLARCQYRGVIRKGKVIRKGHNHHPTDTCGKVGRGDRFQVEDT